jgi:O-acetylserine/cysteine efflux transporter
MQRRTNSESPISGDESMNARDFGLALLPPLLWAVAYTLAKPSVMHFPPLFMAAIAYALAACLLFRPFRRFQTSWWLLVGIATLGGAIQSGLIFIGLHGVPASTAILVVQSQVPFAVLSAWVIGREKLNVWRSIGIVIALAGIAVVAGAPESIGAFSSLALVVLGTLSWGISQALIRRFGQDDGNATMAAISIIAAPQLMILSLLMEHGQMTALRTATPFDWGGVVLLAVGGWAVAYSIWYGLMKRYRVDQVTPFALLMPPLGVVVSYIWLGEHISTDAILGAVVIMVGLTIIVRTPASEALQSKA